MPSWYVHIMNTDKQSPSGTEPYRSLQILDELSKNDSVTQRDLSNGLGIALGLVNSYIKNLIKKGYITVKAIPSKRYAYYLTPKGFAEKTRLTYDLLHDYTRVYREARKSFKQLFQDLQTAGKKKVVFAGADETAEIAYLTLQETRLVLLDVIDDDAAGNDFFGRPIRKLEEVRNMQYDIILVASYLKRNELYKQLIHLGVDKDVIRISLT